MRIIRLFLFGAIVLLLLNPLVSFADEIYTFDPATADYELYATAWGQQQTRQTP